MMPSLLFLAQRLPYPPTKGEKIRHWQVLRHLSQSFRIHFGCLVDDPLDFAHVPTVRALCADAHFARLDRAKARITCLSGLLTGDPLSVTFYRDAGLQRWVDTVLRETRPEAIVVCSSNMAPYVLDRRGDERVCMVDLVDVDSEKWRAYAETGGFPMRWVHRREARLTAALEARILRECDWSVFVSQEEASLFARLQPGRTGGIRAISNGVDHRYFDPTQGWSSPFEPKPGHDFVFTGTMDYPPNIDAVTWFAQTILPMIRRAAPGARFHIVGANPAPRVRALGDLDGVHVTGRVADVRPYIAHAGACVAPMRIARGIQNKVLEAMAMARPVVVTSDALAGIAAEPGIEVLLADGAEAFSRACLTAVGAAGAEIGAAARRRVQRDYGWAEQLRGFDTLLHRATLGHADRLAPAVPA